MRSTLVAALSLLALVAAQHDDSNSANQTIDPGCQQFLNSLDVNPKLDTCLKSINSATAAFNSTEYAASAPRDEIVSSLDALCSSSACSREDIVPILSDFASACKDNLVHIQDVSSLYDLAYNVVPLRNTICSKDGADYCALKKGVVGNPQLELPEGELAQIVMANLDAIGTANTNFLFITPDSDITAICSNCAVNFLSSMVAWQDIVPYAIGLNQSPLLQGQAALWQAVTTKCSADIAANVAVQGGTSPSNATSSALPASRAMPALAALAAGVVAFAL